MTRGTWRSPVAHLNGVQGVAGSNPAVPTGRGTQLSRAPFAVVAIGGPDSTEDRQDCRRQEKKTHRHRAPNRDHPEKSRSQQTEQDRALPAPCRKRNESTGHREQVDQSEAIRMQDYHDQSGNGGDGSHHGDDIPMRDPRPLPRCFHRSASAIRSRRDAVRRPGRRRMCTRHQRGSPSLITTSTSPPTKS